MAGHRRPRRAMNSINVVPYIDVMLVLLVIFMVTAPMLQQGTINLPAVGATTDRELAAKPLRVDIDGSSQLKLTADGVSTTVADNAALVAAIQGQLASTPERPVVIAADKDVKYEVVMQTMDALRRAQVPRVGLLVEQKPGR